MLLFHLTGDEDFLILACDGLWDFVNPPEAVECVTEHLAEGGQRCSVAEVLVDRAKSSGSTDNITVVVVFLDAHKKDEAVNEITSKVPDIDLTEVENLFLFENVTSDLKNWASADKVLDLGPKSLM